MAKRDDYGYGRSNPYGNPAYFHDESPTRGGGFREQASRDASQMELHYAPKVDTYTEDKTTQWCKYLLFTYNLIIFIVGGVMLGVGIWMAVDRNFMTKIVGNDLYAVSLYMILVAGGIIFFISFLGCCGAVTENKCLLYVFMGILVFLAIILLIGGILAIVFHEELGQEIKDSMEDTLVNYYGVDFHKSFNRGVTWGWDKTQEKLYCCGIESNGWDVYRKSKWFEKFGDTADEDGYRSGHEDQKPYVPQSCCVQDRFYRYVNLEVCQKWRLGPPGSPVDGAVNRAVYYTGCYDAGVEYLEENSAILIGLGIAVSLLLVVGIVLAFMLVRRL